MQENIFGKLFPKSLRFWSSSHSVVGIDIGSSSLKIVQLRKEKEQAVLETYGELAIGPYSKHSIGQITQPSEESLVAMLKDLLKESGATSKDVVMSISIKNSFVTTMRVPFLEGQNMSEVIKFEARKYIPVPLSEVEMDWWILNNKNGEEAQDEKVNYRMVEVLLVVIHKAFIEKYQQILRLVGLNIKLFEVEIFSAWRSSVFRQVAPVMIMDMGASITKMSIIDNGILKASHTIDKGSVDITNAISSSLRISFERAEEMKRQIGLSLQPEYKDLVSVEDSVLALVFSEAKQFALSYHRKYNDSVGKVILIGGGALLKGVVDLAVKNLGIEVVLADPFSKTEYSPLLQETLKEIGPIFTTSVGLAMRGLLS